jgi:hypothetical protein
MKWGDGYVMPRFVIRYHGAGPRPEDVVERVRKLPESRIVDDSGRMLLVEAPAAEHLTAAIGKAGGGEWLVAPEQGYAVPDTRKRVERPPAEK